MGKSAKVDSYKNQEEKLAKELAEVEEQLSVCTPSEYLKLAKRYSELQYKLEFIQNMTDTTKKAESERVNKMSSTRVDSNFKYSNC